MWRSHTSFAQRTSLGEAVIICRRQTSFKKRTFVDRQKCVFCWQGLEDLNPRHSVLETDVLPTELNPYERCILYQTKSALSRCFYKKLDKLTLIYKQERICANIRISSLSLHIRILFVYSDTISRIIPAIIHTTDAPIST